MKSEITTNHALADYIRTCQTNAMYGSLESNDITYQSFLNHGFFVIAYDLTCSKTGGVSAFQTPLIRTGNLQKLEE